MNVIFTRKFLLLETPSKRKKVDESVNAKIAKCEEKLKDWLALKEKIAKVSNQRHLTEKSLIFSFIEGSLVKAIKNGN